MCKIDSQWEVAISYGEFNLVLHDNLEGWGGVGVGERFKREGYVYTHGWFMLMDGRNLHNIIKQLSSN